jgi:hypothetical protein
MEEPADSAEPKYGFAIESSDLVARSSEHLQRIRSFQADEVKRRRDGRIKGSLPDSLTGRLRSCNTRQLKTVKALCNRYIKDHRNPPSEIECRKPYTVQILKSVPIKNQRFQLEFRRSQKDADRVYVNGPYVYSYWRDGSLIRSHYFGNKDLSKRLPRKVWSAMKDLTQSAETEERRLKLTEQWSAREE